MTQLAAKHAKGLSLRYDTPHLLWLTKIIASGMKKALAGGGCEGWGRII